jgi:hypothetical protein
VVPRPPPLRHGAARRLRPRLRARDPVRDRDREHSRRDSVPARTAASGVLNLSWVEVVEAAYVAAAVGQTSPRVANGDLARARAAAGAVASRYLAVGAPRSFGLIGDARDAALSLEAHRTWFAPRDIRCAGALIDGGRVTSVDEAPASDIVCIHVPIALVASQPRRGTHVNLLQAGRSTMSCGACDDCRRRTRLCLRPAWSMAASSTITVFVLECGDQLGALDLQ